MRIRCSTDIFVSHECDGEMLDDIDYLYGYEERGSKEERERGRGREKILTNKNERGVLSSVLISCLERCTMVMHLIRSLDVLREIAHTSLFTFKSSVSADA